MNLWGAIGVKEDRKGVYEGKWSRIGMDLEGGADKMDNGMCDTK